MEGLGQRKLIYLGGVLRGITQIRHIFRKVAVMHTKIMLLYFVKVTGGVFLSLLLSPTYHIFQVVSSIDQIFFKKLKCMRKTF